MRACKDSRRGAVMIEFCLVLPLLLVLLLGVIDWGWYFAIRQVAVNAVREGARVGALAPSADGAAANARAAVAGYLRNALGVSFEQVPTVGRATCAGAGYQCVAVSLEAIPVTPGRPDSSITGLGAWTHVPTRLTVRAEMRLEIQP